MAALAAIVGAQVGYEIGRRAGPRLFRRPDSRLFRPEYVERTQGVIDQFGPGRAIVLARFVPIVRTFLNPLMGTIGLPPRRFLLWNVVGGIVWTAGMILLGHAFGNVPFIRKHTLSEPG